MVAVLLTDSMKKNFLCFTTVFCITGIADVVATAFAQADTLIIFACEAIAFITTLNTPGTHSIIAYTTPLIHVFLCSFICSASYAVVIFLTTSLAFYNV